jgi:hypothetical protein
VPARNFERDRRIIMTADAGIHAMEAVPHTSFDGGLT